MMTACGLYCLGLDNDGTLLISTFVCKKFSALVRGFQICEGKEVGLCPKAPSLECVWDNTSMLQWAHSLARLAGTLSPLNKLGMCVPARNGHLEVLRWARANGCQWDERTCYAAAERGHLDVLKWARANGCS